MYEVDDYIKSIQSEETVSCLYVKNAVKRFQSDLLRSDLEFREDKVRQVINFIGSLKHFTGKYSGKHFTLQPWQIFIVANLYGFYWAGTNQRRFNDAYIEIARKNGKTAFAGSSLGLYHLFADGEDAGQILLAANSKEQAHICYDLTHGFTKGFDPGEKYLKRLRTEIRYPKTNSFIKVLAADSDKLDGYNASFGVVDEYHSAPDMKVKNVIESSMAMRTNPLIMVITTAGFNKTLPCYEMRTNAIEVISGVKEEDSLFSMIFTLNEGDDWRDEKNWIKSNPNLDITVRREFLRKQVIKAQNNPGEEVGIKTKNFNIWCDVKQVWISEDYILKATQKLTFEDFKSEETYLGVDLGSVQDMTAVSYEWFRDNKKYAKIKYYLPYESLRTRANKELYQEWARQGYLTITPGNVTDYDYITRDIIEVSKTCSIFKIYYDKWNANQWAINCTEIGLPLEPFSQSIGNFNAPTKEIEKSFLSGTIIIDDNPITRFCFRNVTLRSDYNGNVKPDKSDASRKIDGVIALIQSDAVCVLRNENVYTGNIY